MKKLTNKLPGIALAAIIAVPAWFIGQKIPVVGSPVLGILFGMRWHSGKGLSDSTTASVIPQKSFYSIPLSC